MSKPTPIEIAQWYSSGLRDMLDSKKATQEVEALAHAFIAMEAENTQFTKDILEKHTLLCRARIELRAAREIIENQRQTDSWLT